MTKVEQDAAHVRAVAELLAGPQKVFVLEQSTAPPANSCMLDVFDSEKRAQIELEMTIFDILNEHFSDEDDYQDLIQKAAARIARDPNTFAAPWFGSAIIHPLLVRK